ncbi:MAG: hypothetical protein GY715_13015, partial [Planctomycetes bacterium]|nr:hypothetical protein [Planctomycetota bacterium]
HIDVTGDEADVVPFTEIHLTGGLTTDVPYRQRAATSLAVDGTTDGITLDVHLERDNQSDWNSMNFKVWAKVCTDPSATPPS